MPDDRTGPPQDLRRAQRTIERTSGWSRTRTPESSGRKQATQATRAAAVARRVGDRRQSVNKLTPTRPDQLRSGARNRAVPRDMTQNVVESRSPAHREFCARQGREHDGGEARKFSREVRACAEWAPSKWWPAVGRRGRRGRLNDNSKRWRNHVAVPTSRKDDGCCEGRPVRIPVTSRRNSRANNTSTRWWIRSVFAAEVTRVAKESAPKASGWPGRSARRRRHVEGLQTNVNELASK